jgi:hypothetical protein
MRLVQMIGATGAVALLLGPLAPGPAQAGKEGVTVEVTIPPLPMSGQARAAASATAAQVADEVTLAQEFCARLKQKEYAIDCLAAEYGRIAEGMDGTGALAPAKAALGDASDKLAAIARGNRSTSLPTAVARSSTKSSSRPLVPVETARLPEAADAAIAVIEETETILLRSSETSAEAAGFVAISTAVSSGTILLRSI